LGVEQVENVQYLFDGNTCCMVIHHVDQVR